MAEFVKFLSGGIAGGTVLLLAALIFANLTFSFLRKSKLISREKVFSKTVTINLIVIVSYSLLWAAKKPPQPADRLVILPTLSANNTFELNGNSLLLADLLKRNTYKLKGRYLVHKWEWFYKTLGEEKVAEYQNWKELAINLNPHVLIESSFNKDGDYWLNAYFDGDTLETVIKMDSIEKEFKKFLADLNLYFKTDIKLLLSKKEHLLAEVSVLKNDFESTETILNADSSNAAQLVLAKLFVKRGLQFQYDFNKLKYVDIVNPDFEKAKKILYTLKNQKEDLPEVAFLLGRMAIREREYEKAELFLKKAFIDEPRDARVYYLLSHLLPSRLEELEFKNRKSVLLKTIELDPGFADAVFDLANLFYLSGNGYEKGMGTTGALKTLENYLSLNNQDSKILGLLATLYIKTSKFEKAKDIYQNLAARFPKDSNVIYNLGIVSYSQADYEGALDLFKEAIELDNNLDAYLYAGIASEMLGSKEQALKYYQDRVRLKTSDDDQFAKEAMLGIRKLREEMDRNEPSIQN
ncbi:MAG: hypothetical protein D8M58_19485 [Calditrichaeota bacterium]|nr:MAG: hypothetical protein DWQ03_22165 [Calditrichota bacterium]MBL1207595.1 hypothetical protein [Calditrichota bacterium]NOG47428.1 tetratricopeptide repeat protein [Calditrichota bacterium]